ncbi:MAG: cyanophycin synthetase family protein [Gemmatirosa sp.]
MRPRPVGTDPPVAEPRMTAPARAPDPFTEVRPLALRFIRGPNYWAMRPLVRFDLAVGAYDDIASDDVPGVREALLAALPLLAEHRCSVGVRGGFVQRLTRGTYAPHIAEHVSLAVQELAGQDVSFGRARGGGDPGTYTVVVAYEHPGVGRRSLPHALTLVQHAFSGTLTPDHAREAVQALRVVADAPPRGEDRPPESPALIAAGVTGGDPAMRQRAMRALRDAGAGDLALDGTLCAVAPSALLADGLPYRRSHVAVVCDSEPGPDVHDSYCERDRALRLLSVPLDALAPGGAAVVPAADAEIIAHARTRAATVLTFDDADSLAVRVREAVRAVRVGRAPRGAVAS